MWIELIMDGGLDSDYEATATDLERHAGVGEGVMSLLRYRYLCRHRSHIFRCHGQEVLALLVQPQQLRSLQAENLYL